MFVLVRAINNGNLLEHLKQNPRMFNVLVLQELEIVLDVLVRHKYLDLG